MPGNNRAEKVEKKALDKKPISKCFIQFRPHENYDGEFGFDWLRMGDTTKPKGDNWFGKIMGRYYDNSGNPYEGINDWTNDFRKDLSMYNRKLKSYSLFPSTWKKYKGNLYLYPIPTLTLLKGKTAKFDLKIEIEELPQEITLEFNDPNAVTYLSLNKNKINDIRKEKYTLSDEVTITCNKEFTKVQILEIKADGKRCGAIRVHPNSDNFKEPINVVCIIVDTDINGLTISYNSQVLDMMFFEKCLNQALVIPNITIEKKHLDCTSGLFGLMNTFRDKFCSKDNRGIFYLDDEKYRIPNTNPPIYSKSWDSMLKEFLEGKLKSQFGNKYKNYYTLFFIPEECGNATSGYTLGFSYPNTYFTVFFPRHNRGTLSHETFHAMGLLHSFNNLKIDNPGPKRGTPNYVMSDYTYQAGQTNNIMDYSHQPQFGSIDRKFLFLWQWKTLNSKIIEK